jgi:hypothetical protein
MIDLDNYHPEKAFACALACMFLWPIILASLVGALLFVKWICVSVYLYFVAPHYVLALAWSV